MLWKLRNTIRLIIDSHMYRKSNSTSIVSSTICYDNFFLSGLIIMCLWFEQRRGAIGLAASFLLWPIITHHHPKYNITGNQNPSSATCPTAKTGVLGGGAFLSLNSSLLWLACFILASNVREDYFEDLDGVKKRPQTHTHTHFEKAEAGPTTDVDSSEITSSSH